MHSVIDDDDLRDILQRLQVARWTGHLPGDLGDALLDLVGAMESPSQRRRSRDYWIQRAGERFSGSAWVRAGIVHAELVAQSRDRNAPCRDPDIDWRGCIRAALMVDPHIPSRKQVARILDIAS
jgi:hypothetical protein